MTYLRRWSQAPPAIEAHDALNPNNAVQDQNHSKICGRIEKPHRVLEFKFLSIQEKGADIT
jgi:hypothetical protein